MAEAKNSFIKSKMNKDLDARLLPNGEYREGINIQVSKSEGADVGALENVLGNIELVDLKTLSGCNCNLTTIGLYTDEVNNNIYIFLTDYDERLAPGYNTQLLNYSSSANNYIYVHNTSNKETDLLLTGAFLNFSTTHPILSVNLLEGILFWTDNRNQPRRINIDRAKTLNYYSNEDQISVATYAPFQAIELYQQRAAEYWPNGGSAITTGTAAAGQSLILLSADNRLGLANELDVGKTLVGALVTSDVVGAIPNNSAFCCYSNGNQIQLIDRSALPGAETPVNLLLDLPPGSKIYFNQNLNPITGPTAGTGLGTDNWVTSMEDASSPMNPGGTYNAGYPGLTTNPNYNPKFNGDPDFLEDKFVRFSYRFKFEDGNYSLMAPFTQATFIPKQDGYFIGATTPVGMTTDEQATYRSTVVGFMENKVNNIFLQIPLPLDKDNNGIAANALFSAMQVDEIEILYKESDALAIQVVDTIPRVGTNGYENFGTDTVIEYNYQGDKPYKTLPDSEITRVYDKAPVRAHGQEIISNRLVYSNFQNKHTPPETLDYNVGIGDKYDVFVADDPTVPRPIERTVSREYPMHTVKQNRNYQVGVVLSDRYGRSSTTILSSVNTQALDGELTLLGDTIYFPYNNISSTTPSENLIQKWPGDSIKVLFNTPVEENVPHNLSTGWPGLYNGDPTSDDYNPLGWYSYKIVVKQTEQEYYNVYLPSIMNFYPNLTAAQQSTDAPDPVNTVSFTTLLNDNINKVPRDLTEVGPEQKQFRSSVQLYGRIAPHANATPTYNYQFNPVDDATRIAISDTVSTIADQNNLFDNTSNTKYGSIYQTVSNPSLARISITSNPIGTAAKTAVTDAQTSWLSVYETQPVESRLDIYWETSSSGTIAELNEAIKTGSSAIKNFTTDQDMAAAPNTWTFNLAEDITPGESPTATYSNGVYTSKPFFPYVQDASGIKLMVVNSNIDTTSGFWVTDGENQDVTEKFELIRTAGNGINTPDTYILQISSGTYFYYNTNSPVKDSFTFNFDVQNNDSGSQQGIVTKIAITEKLFNVKPEITCPSEGIVVEPGTSPLYTFEGVNGSAWNEQNQNDLTWRIISQDPIGNGVPELVINDNGEVTDPTDTLNVPVNLEIGLTDAGTNETTIGGVAEGTCAPEVSGNTGYETLPLNSTFGSTKNMCINQAAESSGYYWAAPTPDPVESTPLPPINREVVSGLGLGTSLPSYATSAAADGWQWNNSNRNAQVEMNATNSGLGTVVSSGRSDCVTNVIPVPEGITNGSAYIIVDFELGNYGSAPNDRPGVIWPTYLQYRENSNATWMTAKDVEGNDIKFGGAQADAYYKDSVGSGVTIGGSQFIGGSAFYTTGVKDKLSNAITDEGSGADPATADCFESWMDSRETQVDPLLNSLGRKLFVVGRNQAYRDPGGTAPTDAPDRFGEYRLITRYPYGTNISPTTSSSVTNPKIPTLTPFKTPPFPYDNYTTAQQNQRVWLSFGDFYNPTQLVSFYSNGSGSDSAAPASFAYRVTAACDDRTSAAGAAIDQVVYAREWGFKYVSQFYTDPQLTSGWSPGATNKWFGYTAVSDTSLNTKWGNENSCTRDGAPLWTCPTCPAPDYVIGTMMTQKNMRWTAQFDQMGKKIIRTAEPCVANLDPATGGNNNQCNSPAAAYRYGVMQVYAPGNDKIEFLQTLDALTMSSTCNIYTLFQNVTNNKGAEGSPAAVVGVSEITVRSPNASNCYEKIGSVSFGAGSRATYQTVNLGGYSGTYVTLTIDGATSALDAFQNGTANGGQNWYLQGVPACP